jgi:FAD/FMN-containing dehydrogenase
MGLALGGGGRLEGYYGLVVDGLIHLNVVVADGSEVEVSSTSHPDLLWAMRDAGHNFSIITSYEVKIYPTTSKTWHYHNYTWTWDKVEAVFEQLNLLRSRDNGTTPIFDELHRGFVCYGPCYQHDRGWSYLLELRNLTSVLLT